MCTGGGVGAAEAEVLGECGWLREGRMVGRRYWATLVMSKKVQAMQRSAWRAREGAVVVGVGGDLGELGEPGGLGEFGVVGEDDSVGDGGGDNGEKIRERLGSRDVDNERERRSLLGDGRAGAAGLATDSAARDESTDLVSAEIWAAMILS